MAPPALGCHSFLDIPDQRMMLHRESEFSESLHAQENYLGFTPLHYAVLVESIDCVKPLLSRGANPNIEASGHTPVALAKDNEMKHLLENEAEKGRLTDGKGKTIECKNAIFVMTSNLGSEEIANHAIQLRAENMNSSKSGRRETPSHIELGHWSRDSLAGGYNHNHWLYPPAKTVSTVINHHYGTRSIKHEVERRVISKLAAAQEAGVLKAGSTVHVVVHWPAPGESESEPTIRLQLS